MEDSENEQDPVVASPGVEEDDDDDDEDEFEWEEGGFTAEAEEGSEEKKWDGEVIFSVSGDEAAAAAGRKGNGALKRRRVTAQDRDFAEMVHKAHLLCLLARGRMVDAACDDALLQASALSLVPPSLGLSGVPSAKALGNVVGWFNRFFRVKSVREATLRSSGDNKGALCLEDFSTRLGCVMENQAGSAEELAALAVVLLRSLGFMARHVAVLDVASIKPDAESLEASADLGAGSSGQGGPVFSPEEERESARFVSLAQILAHSVPQTGNGAQRNVTLNGGERGSHSANGVQEAKPAAAAGGGRGKGSSAARSRRQGKTGSGSGVYERAHLASDAEVETDGQKKSGDEELERQLAMAIVATAAAAETHRKGVVPARKRQPAASQPRKQKKIKGLGDTGNASLRQRLASKEEAVGSNGAVWARKFGPVRHWAEVYCSGEGIAEGRWIHVDAARGIVDGADKIEGAAVGRLPLRYVVAFAGNGAKDVTRRYISLWSAVARHRVDQDWWDNTLEPLKQLEAAATPGPSLPFTSLQNPSSSQAAETATAFANGSTSKHPDRPSDPSSDRSALEDMEMETKAFTEPLPTNQQAYKSHHLYAIERWLTKYQTLYPKGPILGFCAGHAVYPRECVQVLHTPDYWLREGFKVRSGESPAKLVKASRFVAKKEIENLTAREVDGMEEMEVKEEKMTALYGKWQTNPWQPPRAVDGKVPRNERGQVDVWSEKCIPPGTVHLRFPGLVPIAQKLEIDFAPAMVGFEARKGRTFPVYDGIVVCEEFKDIIMDAHTAQEEARFSELSKKLEAKAEKERRHLLNSIATRQRLQAAYEETEAAAAATASNAEASRPAADGAHPSDSQPKRGKRKGSQKQAQALQPPHVHHFPEESQSYDEDTGIRTKLCPCGFSYFVEEM